MEKINKLPVLLLLLSICLPLRGQTEFDYSGYILEMPIYQNLPDDLASQSGMKNNLWFNIARVRVKPAVYFDFGGRLNADYELNLLNSSSSSSSSFPFRTITDRQLIQMSWELVNEDKTRLTHTIDRLYYRQSFDWGNVIAGRQRIQWGSGRIWNPTDLFNPINPVDFSMKEKTGADALSMKFYAGDFSDMTVVYNPVDKFNSSNYGFRFRTNYGEYDLSITGGYFDKQKVAGWDIAGNLFSAGVRTEGIITFDDDGYSYTRFIAGADMQFTAKFYMLMEYLYNGEGKRERNEYEIQRLYEGKILNLSRNYICLSAQYEVNPLIFLNLSSFSNLNDGSKFFGVDVNYNMIEDLYLYLGAQIFSGEKGTEYWQFPATLYARGEFYF